MHKMLYFYIIANYFLTIFCRIVKLHNSYCCILCNMTRKTLLVYIISILSQIQVDFMDKKHPLFIGSCGTYHLYTVEKLPTHRPKDRLDYQLLYIASGRAHFILMENLLL